MTDHDFHVYIGHTEAISFETQWDALDRALALSTIPKYKRLDVTVKQCGKVVGRFRAGQQNP